MKKINIVLLASVMLISPVYGEEMKVDDIDKEYYSNKFVDIDDFDSYAEYQEYLDSIPKDQLRDIPKTTANVPAASTVTPTLAYNIVGLQNSINPIQKVYIGSTYIYVLQRDRKIVNGNKTNTGNMTLSRCTINGTTATYESSMNLIGFGHSQSLEYVETKTGNVYFVSACKEKAYSNPIAMWSTQIGRFYYSAGTTINYSSIPRLSYINYANKNREKYNNAEVKRVDCALSSDRTTLYIWMKNENGNIQYSFYDMDELNDLFDNVDDTTQSNTVASTDCKVARTGTAFVGGCYQSSANRILPNDSFQGCELSDGKSIYISGGKKDQVPEMAKITGSIDNSKSYNYTYSKRVSISINKPSGVVGAEIEGIQLKGDYVFFGMCMTNSSGTITHQRVYKILKSEF